MYSNRKSVRIISQYYCFDYFYQIYFYKESCALSQNVGASLNYTINVGIIQMDMGLVLTLMRWSSVACS